MALTHGDNNDGHEPKLRTSNKLQGKHNTTAVNSGDSVYINFTNQHASMTISVAPFVYLSKSSNNPNHGASTCINTGGSISTSTNTNINNTTNHPIYWPPCSRTGQPASRLAADWPTSRKADIPAQPTDWPAGKPAG